MTVKVGDRLPDSTFAIMAENGPDTVSTQQVFANKTVALFAVPGAFTPTCHEQHMPGFLAQLDELTGKGVDTIACTAVNDIFVMSHWADATDATGKVTILADGSALFAKLIGLDIDLTEHGLGVRSKRYAMLVEDGVIKVLNIDEAPPVHDKSSAQTLCSAIGDKV